MRVGINLERFLSDTYKSAAFGLIAISSLAGCATRSPPPLATPETFEAVACEDLVRSKYDRRVKLLELSDRLQRARTAASRGSSGSDGLSQLGDSIANLGHAMRINEIRDEIPLYASKSPPLTTTCRIVVSTQRRPLSPANLPPTYQMPLPDLPRPIPHRHVTRPSTW